jgi:hypothetical protein
MSDEPQFGSSIGSEVAEWFCVFPAVGDRFVRGTDRCRAWRDVDPCEDGWASRLLQCGFGLTGLRHRGVHCVEI